MRFRAYQAGDSEAMYQLDRACFTASFQFDRQTMKQAAEESTAIVVVCDDPDSFEMTAFVIVHLEESHRQRFAYIVTIDVAPGARRRGVGSGLLLEAEHRARRAGVASLGLHVAVDNVGAINFYERQLYQRKGLVKRFYREAGLDAFVYAKDLSLS